MERTTAARLIGTAALPDYRQPQLYSIVPLCWQGLFGKRHAIRASRKKLASRTTIGIKETMAMTVCRGVRGATTVEQDDRDQILLATRQLLALMLRQNEIEAKDIGSAFFTVTKDLNAEFPALAARQLGLLEVPLLCGYEISVPGALPMCIRIMLHWNTSKTQTEIRHVYLHDAIKLRPDLSKLPPVDFDELEEWIRDNMSEN